MVLYLTPYQVASASKVPGNGGFKIHVTDQSCYYWSEFGARGREKPPNGLPRQKPRGYDTLEEAWAFVCEVLANDPELCANPEAYHRLHSIRQIPPTGEFLRLQQKPFSVVCAELYGSAGDGTTE